MADEAQLLGLKLAADQGDPGSQYILGRRSARGEGVPRDPVEAARLYGQAAKQGHAHAQRELGFCYEYGKGVEVDLVEAARLYG
jgi:TPR repeat protein